MVRFLRHAKVRKIVCIETIFGFWGWFCCGCGGKDVVEGGGILVVFEMLNVE